MRIRWDLEMHTEGGGLLIVQLVIELLMQKVITNATILFIAYIFFIIFLNVSLAPSALAQWNIYLSFDLRHRPSDIN